LPSYCFGTTRSAFSFEHNTDEYQPEAETIALRLSDAVTQHDVQRIVHEEFVHWFGDTAGPYERYDVIAGEIWRIHQ
jgi:hypothetical protein